MSLLAPIRRHRAGEAAGSGRAAGVGQAAGSGLLRSVRLFRLFLAEQSDPEKFYAGLAEDAVGQVAEHGRLHGRTVVDIGGGGGWFTAAFRARGAHCYLFEPDPAELSRRTAAPDTPPGAVIAPTAPDTPPGAVIAPTAPDTPPGAVIAPTAPDTPPGAVIAPTAPDTPPGAVIAPTAPDTPPGAVIAPTAPDTPPGAVIAPTAPDTPPGAVIAPTAPDTPPGAVIAPTAPDTPPGAVIAPTAPDTPPGAVIAPTAPAGAVIADGYWLPVRDGCADVAFSSNVLEHVADPIGLIEEMIRVTRPGGLVYLSFTNWYSPWGGHEMSPWHYLGAGYARRRYVRRHRREPKHECGINLFPMHVGPVLRALRARSDVTIVDARPRYYPPWCRWLVRLPGLREVATWNLMLIMRRAG